MQPAPKGSEESAYLLCDGGRDALDALPNIGERSGQLFNFLEDLRDIGQIRLCVLIRAGIAAWLRAGKVERRGLQLHHRLNLAFGHRQEHQQIN